MQHLFHWLANESDGSGSGDVVGSGMMSGSGEHMLGPESGSGDGAGDTALPVSVSNIICKQMENGDTNIVFPVICM